MFVAYTGTSDFQEFGPADFAKAGIEDAKFHRFAQGEPTEVDDNIGEALVAKSGIFGDFLFKDVSSAGENAETDEEAQVKMEKIADKAVDKNIAAAATAGDPTPTSGPKAVAQSSGAGTGGGGTGTGRGSST